MSGKGRYPKALTRSERAPQTNDSSKRLWIATVIYSVEEKGSISSDTNRFVDRCLYSVTIVSLVLKDALTGTQAGAGFVSTRKCSCGNGFS